MSVAEKLVAVAENQEKVFEAGRKSEYDEFWDLFQENGKRTDYSNTFWKGFTNVNFKPKYSMSPTVAANMFWGSKIKGDLEQILEDSGITLDFSKATDIRYLFSQAQFTVVPELDFTSVNTSNSAYYQAVFGWNNTIETVRKVILPSDGSMGFNYWFSSAVKLKNIVFEGVIGRDVDFSACPLSVESMINIITHLAEYRDTENCLKYTVKFSDSCWEALENSEYDVRDYFAQGDSWRGGCDYIGWNT